MTTMQNMNIQVQNLRILSYLNSDCDLTATQIALIVIGTLVVMGLLIWGIKKIVEFF